ncbi:hypothetical protein B0H19DRAFT_1189951 [Mycena capillaripes]|nr:hypothetical protein B0H19DRAFT_1189951 [Mycena capillaripes]
MTQLKTIVVVGGSFSATYLIDQLAPLVYRTHHIVMIESNSHIQHLFAFPRISVVPGFEHKAFIPYTNAFHAAPPYCTSTVQGVASSVLPDRVVLESGESIPYEYLIMATGTGKLPLEPTTKAEGVYEKRALQDRMREARDIVVVGGGAFGIQLAFDTKELYPLKNVTLIHSGEHLMPRFHPKLHSIVAARAARIGIALILRQRVKIPRDGFPTSSPSFTVELADGRLVPADVAVSHCPPSLLLCWNISRLKVACIGATPLSAPLLALSPTSVNAKSREILVKPTMQIADSAWPCVFAVGDVAATGAHKAAGPGHRQADVAVQNIVRMIKGESASAEYVVVTPHIRLSLGLHSYVTFKNPKDTGGEPGVLFIDLEDGTHDEKEISGRYECRVLNVWEKRAPGVTDYYL